MENDVEGLWTGLRGCLLEAADTVCGRTKGPPRRKKTWWWNDEVSKAVGEKQRLYTVWRKDKTEENLVQYNIAKNLSKQMVHAAKEVERKEFMKKLHMEDEHRNVFRITKQIANKNKDVVGSRGIKDTSGGLSLTRRE